MSTFNKAITENISTTSAFNSVFPMPFFFFKINTVASEIKENPEFKNEFSHRSILTYPISAPKHVHPIIDTGLKISMHSSGMETPVRKVKIFR